MNQMCCQPSGAHSLNGLGAGTTHTLALLQEGGLVRENLQSFPETLDLGLAAGLTVLICLWLCNATLLDLAIVLHHGVQLSVRGVPVSGEFGDGFVKTGALQSQ